MEDLLSVKEMGRLPERPIRHERAWNEDVRAWTTPERAGSIGKTRQACRNVAAFLVLGTLAACAATSGSASPSPTQASQSAAAAPSSGTTPPQELMIAWSEADFDTLIGAVTADHGRFVAVSGDPPMRMAWTSEDGTDWAEHSVPEPTGCNELPDGTCIERTAGMGPLARLGDTIYSIGTTVGFNDFLKPIGWRWTDGEAWQAISSNSAFYAYGGLQDLAASDDALVAVRLGESLGPFGAIVWRWTFESSWVASNLNTHESRVDVFDAAWGAGRFVAVGAVPRGEGDFEGLPAAWMSDEGLDWSPVPVPIESERLCSVTSTSLGFMVIGWTADGPMIWRSEDGTSWAGSELDAPAGSATETVLVSFGGCAVTELADGLLATLPTADGTLTWTSVDGMAWIPGAMLDLFAGGRQVAGLGNTIVVAGFRNALYPGEEGATPVLMLGTVNP